MKKPLKIITLIIMTLCLVICATACTFRITENDDNNTADDSSNSSYDSSSTIIDSGTVTITYRNVIFRKNTTTDYTVAITDAYSQRLSAIAKVKRSSVAIITDEGSGSGVVVDMNVLNDDGSVADTDDTIYILTCHHMIESDSTSLGVAIYFPDENCNYDDTELTYTGKIGGAVNSSGAVSLIGGDFTSDIALLKVDLAQNNVAGSKLSDTKKAEIKASKVQIAGDGYSSKEGEDVFSIGNPTGELPGTVSTGTISKVERAGVSVSDIGAMSLMQIDVTSNPGNSGGGLYNLYGDLIGITNAGNTEYQNINFAIPATLSTDSVGAKTSGVTNYGFIYCAEKLLSTATATNYGCIPGNKVKYGFTVAQTSSGLSVQSVTEDSLADVAGLEAGDVITGIKVGSGEWQTLTQLSDLTQVLTGLEIGESFYLKGSRTTISQSRGWGGKITTTSDFTTNVITCQQYWYKYQK